MVSNTYWLYIWVTWRVCVFFLYIKNKNGGCPIRGNSCLSPRAPDFNPSFLVVCALAIFFSFLCYPIIFLYVLGSVLWCPLRFPHKNDIRFVFISRCLYEGSCLIYVICVCLRIVVSNTYCVVLQLCFVVRCLVYPMLLIFSGLSICDCPFGILLTFIPRKLIRHSSPSSSSTLAMIVSFIHGSSSALKLKIHEYIFKCFLYTGLTLFEIMVTLIFRFVRYDQNASKPLISSKQKQKHLIRKQKGVLFYFFDTYFLFLRDWHYIA
jgi:hypothetical protein